MDLPVVIQTIITAVYAMTIIGTILVVISENRNPIRTLAWVLVLVFVPAVGILFFYFFGQANRKKKSISSHYKVMGDKSYTENDAAEIMGIQPAYYMFKLVSLFERNNDTSLFRGREIELMTDGGRKL